MTRVAQIGARRGCCGGMAIVSLLWMTTAAWADDDAAQRQFFEAKIRPLLVEKCQSCHSADERQSEFAADSLDGLLQGGTRGPAVIPGKPAESLLISAVKHGEVLKMPPKEKLTAAQIADLSKWIETGAFWPDAGPVDVMPTRPTFTEPEFTPEQKAFWAFQRPVRPTIPDAIRPGEFRAPLDRFLDAKLAAAGYSPALPADKRTLLRRVTFDLIGLPPTPDELAEFHADSSPDALERNVDRLLASPHYGVKWGRHWLDVARYGDSNGLDENLSFGNAFRYRDYVVEAFNRDKPYDVFVREQIAGDLLKNAGDGRSASEERESFDEIIATGFLSIGPKMLAEDDPVKMQMDIIDEQVDTLGKAFLGMTFGCARCHHHKFDPISAHDYHALAGIFKSTKTMENFSVVARWQERPLASPDKIRGLQNLKDQIAARQNQIQQIVMTTNDRVLTEARRHLGDYLLTAAQEERLERLLANRQPVGNRPDAASLPGVVLLEAENFARGNVLKDATSYGKAIGVLVNKGEAPNFAEYEFDLPQGGSFQIELRYAAAESRPCRLFVNSREIKADAAAKTTGGWYPDKQAWHVEGIYELPAGKVVLRLEHPVYFPHIDKLLLAPAAEISTASSFARLDEMYRPHPVFVKQWRKSLAALPDESRELFTPWTEAARQFVASETASTDSLRQLAAGYQQQAERAIEAKNTDDALRKILLDPQGPFAIPKDQEVGYPPETVAELKTLRDEKTKLESALPVLPEAMSVAELTPEDLRIHFRGSHLTLGEVVPRRFPKIMGGDGAVLGSQGSGRLELAHWLTQPDHPLTSRVIVNRVWTWHFGEGIVRSVDNFGLLGEAPTHPELLDWLATEFPRRQWSLKSLHRGLVGSAAYQRSGAADDVQTEHDPENRLWGRFSRRRLQIEELRDAILAASDMLDDRQNGSLLPTPNRQYVTSTANVNPEIYRTTRRSIYLPVVRSALFDVFQAFDFADPNVSSGQRQTTTVAPQALFLMNSEFVSQQALNWADVLLVDAARTDAERLSLVYRRTLGREPSSAEIARAADFLADYASDVTATTSSAEGRRRAWQSLCRAMMSTNEFVFVD